MAPRQPSLGERGDERFRILVESVKDYGIFILDPSGYVTTWNAGAERLKEYVAEEIVGKHFSIFYPAEDVATGKCDFELETAARVGRFEDEGWRLRKDGTRFWANVIITALFDEGTLVGFAKVTRDLTERKRAEEEVQRFRLLVESVKNYGIFMLDATGHVTTWNAGAERLKGYTASEIIGKHFSVFYPPEVAATGKCEYELEVASREGRFQETGWRIRKDGSLFWADVTITALWEKKVLVGFAKVTRDLTEQREVDEKLRMLAAEKAALAERARVQEFQERFLAILGHDLRNPLAAIDMGTALLQQTVREPAAFRVLDRMRSSGRRMSRMIEQILDLTRSRLDGRLEVNRAPMVLAPVLTGIVEELKAAFPNRVIDLRCAEILGTWDRDRLEQVFSNLIGNALQYGSPETPVRVEAVSKRGSVYLTVHNKGPTIPPELRATLFDPFRRGEKESRTKETAGLGLGLYISRELVLAHGGDIEVRSTPTEGTTFTVKLPLTDHHESRSSIS